MKRELPYFGFALLTTGLVTTLASGCAREEIAIPPRVVEPQLSVRQEYRPCRHSLSSSRSLATVTCPALSDQAARLAALDPYLSGSLNHTHREGLRLLIKPVGDEDLDRAIDHFEHLDRQRDESTVATDLGAAYLVRARVQDRPSDLIRSWAASRRARSLDNEALAPHFNEILALNLLGLSRLAHRAAAAYREKEPDSAWLWEILDTPQTTRPNVSSVRTDTSGNRAASPATRLAEAIGQLLSWAVSTHSDDPVGAMISLDRAESTAKWLERHGDFMLASIVSRIREHLTDQPRSIQDLVRGLLLYQDGRSQATPAMGKACFQNAKDGLSTTWSPIASWISAHELSALAYQRHNHDAVYALLNDVREGTPTTFSLLHARALWVLAASHAAQMHNLEAIAEYRLAIDRYSRLDDRGNATNARARLAELLRLSGRQEESWRERIEVLRSLAEVGAAGKNYALGETSIAIRSLGFPALALELQALTVDAAFATKAPNAVATALRYLGDLLLETGNEEGARGILLDARLYALSIDQTGPRQSVQLLVDELEGKIALDQNPQRAISMFGRALDRAIALDYPQPQASLRAQRAEAYLAIGDEESARTDLTEAVAAIERSWELALQETNAQERAHGQELWRDYLGTGRAFFDQLIRLLVQEGRGAEAFAVAERAKARELLDSMASRSRHREALLRPGAKPAAIRPSLPRNTTVVAYWLLDDRLFIWHLGRSNLTIRSISVDRKGLEHRIASMHRGIAIGTPERELLSELRWLHSKLIEPIESSINPNDLLVIVPDGSLHGVPFAALADNHRFLIERNPIAIVPSANIAAVIWQRNRTRLFPAAPSLLVVSPAFDARLFDGGDFPELSPLPGAALEAREVASRYENAQILNGHDATLSALIDQIAGKTVVHFAGHAVGSPQDSFLVLASDERSPTGALSATNLSLLPLEQTHLVVLSACRTAGGHPIGALGVSRLVRPLLGAGIPAVVGTLWDARDRATQELMGFFHESIQTGEEPADALRIAQRQMLGHPTTNLRSIVGWAAFQVVGGTRPSPANQEK